MAVVNKKVVSVVLEVEEDQPEYFKAVRISDKGDGYYVTEIEGVLFVGNLIPSNKFKGSYLILSDIFALEANEETRKFLSKSNEGLLEFISIMDRYRWEE
ncbi:hypothetical protein D5E69_14330 [Rossellomorea marisflavi]|uniref:hypothetical protein n=1 Tax=Rossellomorea marisflavi TaxID=189381 RepID=UPI00131920D4|nr:hypothetical protein [Rossellomorea marisflavi]QHA36876.1 hypothetical protein D5E69_14330 [Rossellomorea marisflavi]